MNPITLYCGGVIITFLTMLFSDFRYRQKAIADNLFKAPHRYDEAYTEIIIYPFAWIIIWPLAALALISAYSQRG